MTRSACYFSEIYWRVLIAVVIVIIIALIIKSQKSKSQGALASAASYQRVNALILAGDCTNLKSLMPQFNSLITKENLSSYDDATLDKSFKDTIPSLTYNGISFSSSTRQDKINAILNFKKLANDFTSKC